MIPFEFNKNDVAGIKKGKHAIWAAFYEIQDFIDGSLRQSIENSLSLIDSGLDSHDKAGSAAGAVCNIHNGKSAIFRALQIMAGVINSSLLQGIDEGLKLIDAGMQNYYAAESQFQGIEDGVFRLLANHFSLKTVWTTDVQSSKMNEPTPHGDIEKISYHNREIAVSASDKKMTWLDLWKIADALIMEDKDTNHIFIENFLYYPDTKTLEIVTGS